MTELVGKGKPFHSALDKAAGVLKRKVGTGAEFMKELMSLPGIKPTELQERGLTEIMGMPKMTHEQFMAALNAKPAPAIEEKVFKQNPSDKEWFEEVQRKALYEYGRPYGELDHEQQRDVERYTDRDNTYHGDYTLPGGENYREMLIKAPKGAEQFPGVGGHFGGEPNILASMRLKDRKGPNGEKLLHLEELQSDWHQKGREKGYKLQPEQTAPMDSEYRSLVHKNADARSAGREPEPKDVERARQLEAELAKADSTNIPDAPFKKNWEEMALKRLIHHAAEKGYHGVVVTPGMEQAKRYNLGDRLHRIQLVSPNKDNLNNSIFTGYPKEGNQVINRQINTPEELHELIGKEVAEKLMQQKKGAHLRKLEGVDLEVGGEGMKGFYDKKVPNIMNSIGKKYGVKTQLGGHRLNGLPEDYGNAVERLGIAHIPMAQLTPEQNQKIAETADKRLHHFPITEEMRQDVLTNGLPLYAEGGGVPEQHRARFNQVKSEIEARVKINDEYEKQMSRLPLEQIMPFQEWLKTRVQHKAEGGNVQPSVNHMRMALMSNGKFPYTDLQNIGAEEAPSMGVKAYVNPDHGNAMSPGGVSMNNQQLPIGGIDMNTQQPGQQMMPQMQQPAGQVAPSPLSAGQSSPGQQQPSNILQMTRQGQAMNAMTPPKQMAQGGSLHYRKSRPLKQSEIDAMAERMSRQMAQLENPNKKTLKQLEREQNLPINIKSVGTKNTQPIIDFQKLKGASTVGVPGDPSRGGLLPSKKVNPRYGMNMPQAGELLSGIGTTQLEHDIPLFGGYDYGAYGGPDAWASDLGASAGMFNVVKGLHKENPDQDIYGHYHKMTPDSLNHAVHMLDAVMHYHQPHKSGANRISYLNHLMQNVKTTTDKNDIPYPEFPGFENPEDVMLHGTMNSGMRKKIINLLGTEKHFPGGKQKLDDIIFAISHPELRNIETGAGGSAIIKFDPSRDLKTSLSEHPTYAHDIPSSLVGRTRYITPAKILAPRSMQNAEREIKAMGKKVVPFNQAQMNIIREPFDEQYINQMGAYEQAMKKRLGYKSGGKVKETTNLDTMKLQLMRKPKKAK